MIVIICQDANNDSGWGTYANQYSKIINSFEKTIIICHKKNRNLNIKQYDILHHVNEYLSNPIKIIADAFKVKKILNIIDSKPTLHVIAEPYALLIPFLKKSFSKILLSFHGSFFLKLTIQGNFISKFLFKKAMGFPRNYYESSISQWEKSNVKAYNTGNEKR